MESIPCWNKSCAIQVVRSNLCSQPCSSFRFVSKNLLLLQQSSVYIGKQRNATCLSFYDIYSRNMHDLGLWYRLRPNVYMPIENQYDILWCGTNSGCHASMMMTWRPICPCSLVCALTDDLVVAGRCPTTHHRGATSSTRLLPDLRELASLSLTTECRGHSQKLWLEGLLVEGCNPASGICPSSVTHDIWPQY